MTDPERLSPQTLSIAAVERDTGLSKDTLRVWERRYGFPRPERDRTGNRVYPLDQVQRLRVIRRLIDVGHRPGSVVMLQSQDLDALSTSAIVVLPARNAARGGVPELAPYLDLVGRHDAQNLQHELGQCALRLGLVDFITLVLGPLTTAVGDAWASGRIQVFGEHLYTEVVVGVLRGAIASIPAPQNFVAPRVLLTTIPKEPHGLGLLMAESLFALDGCRCLPLGPQTPVDDTAQAARGWQADIVALSFTATLDGNAVLAALRQLRSQLPQRAAIWVGGQCPSCVDAKSRTCSRCRSWNPCLSAWRTGAASQWMARQIPGPCCQTQ